MTLRLVTFIFSKVQLPYFGAASIFVNLDTLLDFKLTQ